MRSRSLLHVDPRSLDSSTLPILAKGFRPFFWLAALYAVLVMPLWLVALGGRLELPAYFGGSFWHAHEMIFGFTIAVITGFLLTAVENWTERETARGLSLALLALFWILGRAAMFTAGILPRGLVAFIDLSFVPLVALACARPIAAARARRNYVFLAMLFALFAANAAMHAGALGLGQTWVQKGARIGVDIVVLMMLVITARVVPMFTRNATRRVEIHSNPRLDKASVVAMLSVLLADILGLEETVVAMLAFATALLVFGRSWTWGTRYTFRDPLLWVLHVGHAWIAMGLGLRGLALFVPEIGATHSLHALTAGAISMLTLGMMARVSLGHTGRMLAAPRGLSAAFVLALLAALVRVFAPMFGPSAYLSAMMISGTLFSVAFLVFWLRYTPILFAARVDGKPG